MRGIRSQAVVRLATIAIDLGLEFQCDRFGDWSRRPVPAAARLLLPPKHWLGNDCASGGWASATPSGPTDRLGPDLLAG